MLSNFSSDEATKPKTFNSAEHGSYFSPIFSTFRFAFAITIIPTKHPTEQTSD